MGMSSYEMLVDEIVATMQAKGPYAGVERLETLRAEGNSNATTCLGELYLEGIGVIADVEMGIALLQEAASEGNPNAYETLGSLYLHGSFGVTENAPEGHEYIEKAANEGLPGAMGICACDYYYGRGVALSHETGFEWALRGAKLGDTTSNALCGVAYQTGVGTARNIPLAIQHYRETLKSDPENTDVMCDFAICLSDMSNEYGTFPSQSDYQEAFDLLSRAVEAGDVRAHGLLGIMYADGVGIDRDYDLAHHYIELAANNGYEPAQEMLPHFRRNMRGKWTV